MQALTHLRATCLIAALALAAGPAAAAVLRLGELELHYDSPWQRADAEEESRAQSVILRHEDAGRALTVMLPHHHTRLREPPERFYRQLETVWRAQYGQAATMEWLEMGGLRWRMLRRPSLDRPGDVVFHLVTVIDGRAHHLLAYAPAAAAELPVAVRQLLTGPVGGMPAPSPAPVAIAQPAGWRLERVLRIQPGQAGLDRVMAMEQRALKGEGGITGLELKAMEHGLKASLQGFVWVTGPERRQVRREFMHHWDVAWSALPAFWRDDEALAFVPSAGAGSDRVGLQIGLRLLCGESEPLRALLDGLERAPGDVNERLQAGFVSCRQRPGTFTQAETTLSAGEPARPILIQPPEPRVLSADGQGLLVLSVQPRIGDGQPGQALLGAGSVHYVYVRGP
jgi:hypothetical protein